MMIRNLKNVSTSSIDEGVDATGRFGLQRLRRTPVIRELFAETRIVAEQLVMPLFVTGGETREHRWDVFANWSRNDLLTAVSRMRDQGVQSFLLFGIPEDKCAQAKQATARGNFLVQSIADIKRRFPEVTLITDVCLCSHTSHGHCGLVGESGEIQQAASLDALAEMACLHAEAGADLVAPSAMLDGMVAAIRRELDLHGLQQTGILSYSTKFASALYGPFRDAAKSAPQWGDRKAYQLDPRNRQQAIAESLQDDAEGADVLMVKPAGFYLDLIREIKNAVPRRPLAAYQVSGEYAMIRGAAEGGWLDEAAAIVESLTAIKRAGADLLITYFAQDWNRVSGQRG